MEFLLDPDVAYLFLLGGVFLALMAIATPGTGFFEIGAFFCFALAGYAIYNISINFWALIVIGLGVVPFVYALQKPKEESPHLSGSARSFVPPRKLLPHSCLRDPSVADDATPNEYLVP